MSDPTSTNGNATPEILTTNFGAPVSDNQNSMSAGNPGPLLIADYHLLEKNAHFNRERVPERVVHAKGAGAFGYFEVTNDVTPYTKAALFASKGKRTEMLARFSTVAGERGAADTERDPRGFALKFYTEEGNYDLVGNNTPIFFIRDPLKFPDFIHSQKRHPQTNLRDNDMQWDFWSLSPESLHQVTYLMGDRGIPQSHQFMNGYGSHTYSWINADGKMVWVKYHMKTEQGIRNFTRQEAAAVVAADPDYATRTLFDQIEKGEPACWKMYVQIMPLEDAASYRFDPFDVTKVWSHKDYPLLEVGRIVLDKNPDNYFAQIEQAAFEPSNVVPGIWFSPDKMLQGRIFAYADAHRYRIGPNYHQLPVNQAKNAPVHNYGRDGNMNAGENGGKAINYEPNSRNGPVEAKQFMEPSQAVAGETGRFEQHAVRNDNYTQPGDLYRLMDAGAQDRLVDAVVTGMKPVRKEVQQRQVEHWRKVDASLGERVGQGLGLGQPART
ncbi:MAG TPA: catalase [Candidatus Baltobacteraceae bacterium]|jgi:catalase